MGQYEKDKAELLEKIEKLEHKLKKAKQEGDKDDVDKYSRKLADRRAKLASLGKEMDALQRELRRKRMSQKPQLSSSQRFDLRDRVFCLTDGFVPNGNANLGRPPRQPGHRPHRKHGQAMGGMNLEDFLAGGGGGMAMAAMGGLLLSMALGDH